VDLLRPKEPFIRLGVQASPGEGQFGGYVFPTWKFFDHFFLLLTGTTLSIPDELVSKPAAAMVDIKAELNSSSGGSSSTMSVSADPLTDVNGASSSAGNELDDTAGSSTPKPAPIAKKGKSYLIRLNCSFSIPSVL